MPFGMGDEYQQQVDKLILARQALKKLYKVTKDGARIPRMQEVLDEIQEVDQKLVNMFSVWPVSGQTRGVNGKTIKPDWVKQY